MVQIIYTPRSLHSQGDEWKLNPAHADSWATKLGTQKGDAFFFLKFVQKHWIGSSHPGFHHRKLVLTDLWVQLTPFAAKVPCSLWEDSLLPGALGWGSSRMITSGTQQHGYCPSSPSKIYLGNQLFLLKPLPELWVLWIDCVCPPPNLYIETLISNVVVFGDGAFRS